VTDGEIAAYVDAACAANGLELTDNERLRVMGHFARTAALAAPLLELELPPDADMAPVFRP
jgi:Protein of unknown function (DUF4089)